MSFERIEELRREIEKNLADRRTVEKSISNFDGYDPSSLVKVQRDEAGLQVLVSREKLKSYEDRYFELQILFMEICDELQKLSIENLQLKSRLNTSNRIEESIQSRTKEIQFDLDGFKSQMMNWFYIKERENEVLDENEREMLKLMKSLFFK